MELKERKRKYGVVLVRQKKSRDAEAAHQHRLSKKQLRLYQTSLAVEQMLEQGKTTSQEADRMQQILQNELRKHLDDDLLHEDQVKHEDPPPYDNQFRPKVKPTKLPVRVASNPNHQPQCQDCRSFPVRDSVSNGKSDNDIRRIQLRNHQQQQHPVDQAQQHLHPGAAASDLMARHWRLCMPKNQDHQENLPPATP